MRNLLHRLLLPIITLLACAALPGLALAHAALTGALPVDGSTVAAAPEKLTLSFSEPVSPLALRLIGPDGVTRALDGFALKGSTLEIQAPAGLANGTHVLSWRVVSEDGHPVGGSVVFSVGAPSAGAPAIAEQGDPAVRGLVWLSRFSLYLALFLGCGAVASRIGVGALEPPARRVAAGLLALGVLALPAALVGQGLDALGADIGAALQPAIWRAALATSYAVTIAIAALALLAGLIGLRAGGPIGAAASVAGIALAGLALVASGHASAAQPQWLMRPAVFLHATAVALWVGALIPLAFALRVSDGAAALRRFSRAITVVIAILLLSGLALAVVQVERPSALVETAYGKVLIAKLALVAFILLLAGFNRWRLTVRVEAGEVPAAHAMTRVIAIELAALILVFGTAALWRFTPPPRAIAIAQAQPASIHIHTLQAMADVTVTPGRVGPVTVTVTLLNGEFGPLPAKETNLSFVNPAAGIEPIERSAKLGEDGIWRVEGVTLPVPGLWTVELEILVSDFEMRRIKGEVEISP